ncbi:MAG: cobalamin-dependent protein [Lachnospiraceae bacterium]|nr:cobalamin-dependent protein [Lachnospiraceae bacterium]
MMTQRERFLALLHNEPVDGFVNMYGCLGGLAGFLLGTPLSRIEPRIPGQTVVNGWGVTYEWPAGEPGAVPNTDPEHVVIKDIENWKKYVKTPDLHTEDSEWDNAREQARAIRAAGEHFVAPFFVPGNFEMTHCLMPFEDCLANLLAYPDEMHELLDVITNWRIDQLEEYFKHVPEIDMVFAHDDWGSKISTFMAPEVFHEFYTPRYKKIYQVAKDHGAIVVHHSDSYCTTLIDDMFEMNIDCWEGVLPSNDIHMLQKKLNDENREFILWGGLDSGVFDRDDSTEEEIRTHVQETIAKYFDGGHWIPSINDGLPIIIHQQNYAIIEDEIRNQEKIYFPDGKTFTNPVNKSYVAPSAAAEAAVEVKTEAAAAPADESDNTLAEIADAMTRGKSKIVKKLVPEALEKGVDPQKILDTLLSTMGVIGEKFKNNEVFVPEVLVSARAMNAGTAILKPYLAGEGSENKGVAIIGTVQGDLHDIGKNLVRMMVEGKGIEVVDAGVDVSPEQFIDLIKEHNAKLVLLSALLTTTMPAIPKTIEAIVEAGLRDQVKIMVGGAPITPEFAAEIGADAYTPDASSAANSAAELMKFWESI